jgi:methylase of polypeptide subunit release factors
MSSHKSIIEFGDFQTPSGLAMQVCQLLSEMGVKPQWIIEPTCGKGEFLWAAKDAFPSCKIRGFEINTDYCFQAVHRLALQSENKHDIQILQADFFRNDWQTSLPPRDQELLILGNPPWVTNSVLSNLESANAPIKTNFQAKSGMEAMTGSANFDISEWMLLQMLDWFQKRNGVLALLVKSAVARKVLMHAHTRQSAIKEAWMAKIDAKLHFGVSVDACLLFMRFDSRATQPFAAYSVYSNLKMNHCQKVGMINGMWVSDVQALQDHANLLRKEKSADTHKWRSGIKHDAAAVCEFKQSGAFLQNGLGHTVDIEDDYLFPLLKGSEVANDAVWSQRRVLVTQKSVGQNTDLISVLAPKTWSYLQQHAEVFDRRVSSIYKNNPRFSIFGVGEYSFMPWRIAICSLYKRLNFVLVEPINGKPVMFDDTVYYLSFAKREQAVAALSQLQSAAVQRVLNAMIFWDDKRPIKTSILNKIALEIESIELKSSQSALEFV